VLVFATLTTLLLADPPPQPKAALVFMQVESPTEKDATPLLEESLRHSFSTRMSVITCKEAIQDETALKKVLEGRDIKSSADAPKKVSLLTNFSKYDCEIPDDGALWAAWLTAYVDARNGRREVSLRMRNLRDKESIPAFASLAEPQNTRLSWSELVERCVRRYFDEEAATEVQISPSARVRVRDPVALSVRFAFARAQESKNMMIAWSLYQCWERSTCDQFRARVEEYVQCRRSNRTRSASDPSLTPVCVNPVESYDRVGVTLLSDRSHSWIHFDSEKRSTRVTAVGATLPAGGEYFTTESRATTLTVDIPGEYVLVAYMLRRPDASGDAVRALGGEDLAPPLVDIDAAHAGDAGETSGDVAGAQRLTVEPPFDAAVFSLGVAYKPFDGFAMLGYQQVVTQWPMVGVVGVGLQWALRWGTSEARPPPFGPRGVVAPSLVVRHHFNDELAIEPWFAPLGLLYEFKDTEGYSLQPGTMLGVAFIWHPRWLSVLYLRAGAFGLTRSTSLTTAEIYGPLLGVSLEL
jgi:hypothetical protein